jgi:flagellar biosynthesis GTPase FlhF
MSSTQEKPDLSPLQDNYDVVGEVGGRDHTKAYVGKRKEDGRDVLITVMQAAADVAEGKAIAQFAADANLLATLRHPNVPQVIEGRWIGDDAFALVSDRVQGTTLAELLKGDRISNPRIADILGDVDGVLEWARGERLSHRGVTPDGITIERGTNKVFVALSPTDAPKTNRPDARDDARTIGALAMAMLTAKPMADDHDGTLANMRPDLPQRVIDATERVAACTMNDEQPNISAYLASVAMADAIKEGELEVARIDAEFRAQMKAEREKWEAEQHASQLANEAQVQKFGEERVEYERRAAKEREQLATARAEIDKRRAEVQQARAELDQARADFKQRKSELEARVKEIDRHAHGLEKQKRELEKHSRDLEKKKLELERKNHELTEAATLAAMASETSMASLKERLTQPMVRSDETSRPTETFDVVRETTRPTVPVEAVADEDVTEQEFAAAEADVPEMIAAEEIAGGIESVEDVHEPWTAIEETEPWAVPFDTDEPVAGIAYEAAALPELEKKEGRPRWMVPAGIAAFVVLLVGTAYGVNRHNSVSASPITVAALTSAGAFRRPDTAAIPSASVTDSAAGTIAPAVPATLADSAVFTAIRDSIIQADAERRSARQAKVAAADAAAATERAAQTVTDSTGQKWSTLPPPPIDSVARAAAKKDSIVKKDTTVKVKPDTLVRPDTGSSRRR